MSIFKPKSSRQNIFPHLRVREGEGKGGGGEGISSQPNERLIENWMSEYARLYP